MSGWTVTVIVKGKDGNNNRSVLNNLTRKAALRWLHLSGENLVEVAVYEPNGKLKGRFVGEAAPF